MILNNSAVLKKLTPALQKAAERIKQAVQDRQPIIIRHHNDTDGFSAGIALELGIKPLLNELYARERDVANYFKRMPLLGPFYSYEDATKDTSRAHLVARQFGNKLPLIIICDTGSGVDSLAGIQKAVLYGAEVIVLDHHPNVEQVDRYLAAHINPHCIGSTYDYCAGMLAAELAHEITQNNSKEFLKQLTFIASVAAIADKVASKEKEEYMKIAQEHGCTTQRMERVADAIDFEAYTLGPNNGEPTMYDLLGTDEKKQAKLLNIIERQMKPRLEAVQKSCVTYAGENDKGFFTLVTIPVFKCRTKGSFPGTGRACSLTLEHFKKTKNKLIVMGLSETACSFRASTEITEFDVNKIIALLQKKLPHAQVSGGGHRVAGTINFIAAAHEEVLAEINAFIDTIKN